MNGETIVAIGSAVVAAAAAYYAWKEANRSAAAAERSTAADESSAAVAKRLLELEEERAVGEREDRQRAIVPRLDLGDLHGGTWVMDGQGGEPTGITGSIMNHGPGTAFIEQIAIDVATADVRDRFEQSRPLAEGEIHDVELRWRAHSVDQPVALVVTFSAPDAGTRHRARFPLYVAQRDAFGYPVWKGAGPGTEPA